MSDIWHEFLALQAEYGENLPPGWEYVLEVQKLIERHGKWHFPLDGNYDVAYAVIGGGGSPPKILPGDPFFGCKFTRGESELSVTTQGLHAFTTYAVAEWGDWTATNPLKLGLRGLQTVQHVWIFNFYTE